MCAWYIISNVCTCLILVYNHFFDISKAVLYQQICLADFLVKSLCIYVGNLGADVLRYEKVKEWDGTCKSMPDPHAQEDSAITSTQRLVETELQLFVKANELYSVGIYQLLLQQKCWFIATLLQPYVHGPMELKDESEVYSMSAFYSIK
ncbi:hypothetical protein JOM56_013190 [Amanita muscaria]